MKKKHEAKFTTKFLKWLKYNFPRTANFELKIVTEKSIPFSAVKEHQIHALKTAERESIVYKIPDEGFAQKPFDCFKQVCIPGYIVVHWIRRGNKKFYIITVDTWITKQETSKKKSLDETEIENIAYLVGELESNPLEVASSQ